MRSSYKTTVFALVVAVLCTGPTALADLVIQLDDGLFDPVESNVGSWDAIDGSPFHFLANAQNLPGRPEIVLAQVDTPGQGAGRGAASLAAAALMATKTSCMT